MLRKPVYKKGLTAAQYKAKRGQVSDHKKLAKVVKKVNKIAPLKNKCYLTNVGPFVPDNTGTNGALSLCTPSQGDTSVQRTGDRIRLNSVKYYVSMTLKASGLVTENQEVRMIILYDKENVFTSGIQLINNSTQNLAVGSDYIQDERPRWIKLVDKVFTWDKYTVVNAGTSGAYTNHIGRINLKQKLTTFVPAGTGVFHGALKVLFIGNKLNANSQVSATFSSETWFSDVL